MSPTLRRVPRLLFLLLLLPVLYLLLWPVPIDPEVWAPPAPRAWVPTGTLAGAQRVELPAKTRTVRFAVIGDEFKRNGSILGWRCTLLQGGVVLGEEKSFLWE